MRESRSSGSVEGVFSNGHLYSDSLACDDESILAFMAQVRICKLESQSRPGRTMSPYRSAAYLRPRRTRARAMPTWVMRRSSSRPPTRQVQTSH